MHSVILGEHRPILLCKGASDMKRSVKLDIDDVTKIFPGGRRQEDVYAVRDCSLSVAPGEFVSLLGPSGCGKTTLLRIVAGFEEATEGSVFVDGNPVQHLPAHKRDMAMVFQNYALFPHMSVIDNVAYSLKLKRLPSDMIRSRATEMLRIVGLEGMGDRSTSQLSGGQQQRVALARAIIKEPSILLLDEPLSNLDVKLRVQMRSEIRLLQQEFGITTLYVTHDQEEALVLSDRIVVMRDGVIEQVGTPRELYEKPMTAFVADFLGSTNILRGRVAQRDSRTTVVHILGREMTIPSESHVETELFSIRPEAISLVALNGASLHQESPAIVRTAVYMGVWVEYVVETDGQRLMVRELAEPGKALKGIGDTVALSFDVQAIRPILPS